MTARELKTEALCWLRYVKRMPIVATEVGGWNADVLGLNNKSSIEVEVKVSKSDLKAEFRNKRAKHYLYGGAGTNFVPNYFYVLVPEDLKDAALEVLETQNQKYGLIVYHKQTWGRPGEKCEVVRRASRLHDGPPSRKMVQAGIERMSSEICNFHIGFDRLSESIGDAKNSIAESAAKLAQVVEKIEPEEAGSTPEPDVLEKP